MKKRAGWHDSGGLYCICSLWKCDYYDVQQPYCKAPCAQTHCLKSHFMSVDTFGAAWRATSQAVQSSFKCEACPKPVVPLSYVVSESSTFDAGNPFLSLGRVWATLLLGLSSACHQRRHQAVAGRERQQRVAVSHGGGGRGWSGLCVPAVAGMTFGGAMCARARAVCCRPASASTPARWRALNPSCCATRAVRLSSCAT